MWGVIRGSYKRWGELIILRKSRSLLFRHNKKVKCFEILGQNVVLGLAKGYLELMFVKDDIETGFANVIPRWAFGLNY